ncbi:MAG TPA: VOC family protein [Permianibacter sp.]|nr:VOC family protein [Permianibacter sp.]
MHHSRLAGFIIDCQDIAPSESVRFWSAALGMPERKSQANEDAGYALLDTGAYGLHIETQRVSHESRLHLDIESDDVEAEADRLERLGATRVKKVRHWWVMQAPTGHRFCVVYCADVANRPGANRWD